MSQKIRLFELLRRGLGETLKGLEFDEIPFDKKNPTFLIYKAAIGEDELELSFQRSPNPMFVEVLGSSFVINFRFKPKAQFTRQSRLLTEDDLLQLREIQNRILQRLDIQTQSSLDSLGLDPMSQMLLRKSVQQIEQPLTGAEDLWLRFSTRNDVEEWITFLRPRFGKMRDRFLVMENRSAVSSSA